MRSLPTPAKAGLIGLFTLVLVVLTVPVLVSSVRLTYAHLGGTPGAVTDLACEQPFRNGSGDDWTCHGRFVSDDGATTISRVRVVPDLVDRPTAPVAARVAGAEAGDALAKGHGPWTRLIGGVGLALVTLAWLIGVLRLVRRADTGRIDGRVRSAEDGA